QRTMRRVTRCMGEPVGKAGVARYDGAPLLRTPALRGSCSPLRRGWTWRASRFHRRGGRSAAWLAPFVGICLAASSVRADDDCPAAKIVELERPRWVKHRVAPRERAEQIAHRYRVSPEELRAWNQLSEQGEPATGRVLRIHTRRPSPARERIDVVVEEGDTWWSVAARYGVDSKDLRAYNWPYEHKMT